MGQIAELIKAVLDGRSDPEELGPCWRADLAMPIYEEACRILKLPTDKRRAEIERHAPKISRLVAAEVTRIYRQRK